MSNREKALSYAQENKEKFLDELKEVLRIPSVSTDSARKDDMLRVAEWLVEKLEVLGMENVEIFPTAKHPVVYADWLHAKDAPTVLIYGHYDVQPEDPLDLWETPPFEPTQRGDSLHARGASDMKGQVVATLKAVEAIVKNGELPCNIKFMIEGEEEIGSPNLLDFMEMHKELLAADFCLNPDAGMLGKELPSITYALRGLAYFEIHVTGPSHDLHSGLFGGAVRNPANTLMTLIAGMKDENGHITLPGFYDKVRAIDAEERAELAKLPVNEEFLLKQTGSPSLWGEKGYTPVEQIGARPTLDVNGMLSGFTGEGAKTVLPAKAMAKISMRLVPDQTPDEVYEQLVQYMEENAPDGVKWDIKVEHGGNPSISELGGVGVKAMSDAMSTVWGTPPLFKREGGSIPVVGDMQKALGIESVLTGFGLPDDRIHSPNEKQDLPTWYRGIDALIHFFYNLA
ncbi:MAG: dipeptidase [Anaerolineae bacterium]|jgi:acetylornithine deacetylase/succinyl-diaminopimelate desuccinylase-like protein|nr:dipeptidase [Anaerolineae bacterium]MBT4309599.1 dipeptidase [Anaerolineae bacterium]MBT4458329.1 dipeptidase [Anaerolineae bacterium]MBT4840858.1 dipeptidase [Anaerolineae bacterium]MBT6059761.1 dipeptidase [Anaerolineae bacterium]